MAPRKRKIADIRAQITDESGRLKHAPSHEEFDSMDFEEESPDLAPPDDRPSFTANQLVAYNVRRARAARGWSQEYLGRQLEHVTGRVWSKATVSAAESSWRGGRPRRFDANELLAFSSVFKVPIGYFFLPPDEAEFADASFLADVLDKIDIKAFPRNELLDAIWNTMEPASEFFDRFDHQLRTQGIEWSPGRSSFNIGVNWNDPEHVANLIKVLQSVKMPDDPKPAEGEDRG